MANNLERIFAEMDEDRLKDIEQRAREIAEERAKTLNTVHKLGDYILTQDVPVSNAHGVGTIMKGLIFHVSQLDEVNRKFYSKSFGDWQGVSLPCLYLGDD